VGNSERRWHDLADIVNGKVTWSRWEQSPSGYLRSSIIRCLKSASHYQVIGLQSNSRLWPHASDTGGSRGTLGIGITNNGTQPRDTLIVEPGQFTMATLGEPATGAVLRLRFRPTRKMGVLFAGRIFSFSSPVEIAGAVFICPSEALHSRSLRECGRHRRRCTDTVVERDPVSPAITGSVQRCAILKDTAYP